MELNRSLVKSQARQLIKNRVVALFLITMVFSLLMGLTNAGSNVNKAVDNFEDNNNGFHYEDDNPIENFGNYGFDRNYFDGITGSINATTNLHFNKAVAPYLTGVFSGFSGIVSILLCPMYFGIITLYLRLSRNEFDGLGKEFENSFRVSFDRYYFKKIGLLLLKAVLIFLFSLLLIIPGIVKAYKLYFSEFIMAENPEMTIGQANRVSQQMTDNHKTELFKMDLSFILWYILIGLTFGIASIYVIPYVYATKALYYQNFKARCMQEHRLTEFDFMSDEERIKAYNEQNSNANSNSNVYGQNPSQNNYYNASTSYNNVKQAQYGQYAQNTVYNENNQGYGSQNIYNQPNNAAYNVPKSSSNGFEVNDNTKPKEAVKVTNTADIDTVIEDIKKENINATSIDNSNSDLGDIKEDTKQTIVENANVDIVKDNIENNDND